MSDFLQVVEALQAEQATTQRLFGGEGRSVRGSNAPGYLAKLSEAAKFIAAVVEGRKPAYLLQEALTTSDFPQLFGDILDRQLLANYREWPRTYQNYCKVSQVRDFRTVKRFRVDGAESVLGTVAEQAEYPASSVSDDQYSYSVAKYGRRMPFSWETIINDDLDALKDIPMRFGRAARRTEERFATALFVSSTGPNSTFFSNTNKNIVNTTNGATATNPPLSISGLQDAFTVLMNQVDSDGEPIVVEAVELVVPTALEVTAMNILNALELRINEAGGTSNQQLVTTNWMKSRVRVSVNPYLSLIATTNGKTSWYLFANPNNGRPAIEVGFLRGHTEPEIFLKEPNARRVGGASDPMGGDFDTDSLQYKVRHVLGGTLMDPKMAVASNGSGS